MFLTVVYNYLNNRTDHYSYVGPEHCDLVYERSGKTILGKLSVLL